MSADRFTYYAFSAAWAITGRMGDANAYRLFSRAAAVGYKKNGPAVQQLRKNLTRVCPDLSPAAMNDLVRANLDSHARYWCELFLMSHWTQQRINEVDLHNVGALEQASADSTGVICVGAHSGNYDHVTAAAALRFAPVTAVAERLKPEKLFNKFAAVRETNGIHVIAAGTPDIMASLSHALTNGHIIALMGDRDLSRKGIPVEFFGEATKMPAGPALLSYRTGAPILPVGFYYTQKVSTGRGGDVLHADTTLAEDDAVAVTTQQVAVALENEIKANPQDWHMMQPLWLDDLTPRPTR